MRIGMFTELYPPSVGGVEARVAELAGALSKAGHDVEVYCIGQERGLEADGFVRGIPVHRHPIIGDYRRSLIPGMPRSASAILRYGWRTRKVLCDRAFDFHIFSQWPFSHVLLAPRVARRRALIDWCEVRGGRVYGFFERWFPRLTPLNMAVSSAVARQMRDVSGRPVFTLSSGVTLANYWTAPAEERRDIVYIGRLFPHKRVPLLVEAFGRLRAHGYRGRLAIAGDGPDRPVVETARSRLAAADQDAVDLLGHIDDDAKISLLARSQLLVLPSRREGFPLVVAEAMAAGLPVVTTSDPGNGTREVVAEHRLGAVADPSVESLTSAIEAVLGDWGTYSANALAAAPALDWDHLVSVLEGMISEPSRLG